MSIARPSANCSRIAAMRSGASPSGSASAIGSRPLASAALRPMSCVKPSLLHSMRPAASVIMTPFWVRAATSASLCAAASLRASAASERSRRLSWTRISEISAAITPASTSVMSSSESSWSRHCASAAARSTPTSMVIG